MICLHKDHPGYERTLYSPAVAVREVVERITTPIDRLGGVLPPFCPPTARSATPEEAARLAAALAEGIALALQASQQRRRRVIISTDYGAQGLLADAAERSGVPLWRQALVGVWQDDAIILPAKLRMSVTDDPDAWRCPGCGAVIYLT